MAVFACTLSSGSPFTATDTAGNSYTRLTKYARAGDGAVVCAWFYAYNITGNAANAVSIVCTTFQCQYVTLQVREYSGVQTSSDPVDVDTGGGVAPTTTAVSPSFTTTFSRELILMGGYNQDAPNNISTGIYSAGSGYGDLVQDSNRGSGTEDKVVSSIQTGITASIVNALSNNWAAAVATFKGQ